MTAATWLLIYDVADANAAAYLDWFHGEHIPDKLARPGYDWAAHYRGPSRSTADGEARSGYIALFGGAGTRVFLDPSPAQHRARQDERTRSMMPHRVGTLSGVFALEWLAGDGADVLGGAAPALRAEVVDGDDEAVGAWCAQSWLPARRAPGVAGKWVNVTGSPRHLLLAGHSSLEGAALPVEVPADAHRADEAMRPAAVHGERIWPPIQAAP